MQPLLLLHGAIGAADQMQPLAASLEGFNAISLNFSGHGGEPFPDNPFSIGLFAEEVIAFMDRQKIQQADLFGYSMGGYVAMYLAKNHPARIGKLITLATKFHWDPAIAEKECQMLNAEKIEAKLPAFAAALAKRHSPNDWKQVLQRTADMLKALGQNNTLRTEDYITIDVPCLILLGDRDKMVTLEETVNVYKSLPNARMGVLPDTHHPIEQINLDALRFLIRQFLDS